MPSYGNTTIWALRKLLGSSNANDIDAGIAALADDVDTKLTPASSGTLAARPVSTVGSPSGKAGRTYRTTDTTQLFKDNGTGWDEIVVVPTAAQTWQTITLPASLSSGSLAYYKDSLGIVRFRGDAFVGASTTSPGAVLCTLPAGYRPGTTHNGSIQQVSGAAPAPATISTAGVITLGSQQLVAVGNTYAFTPLGGFRAEN